MARQGRSLALVVLVAFGLLAVASAVEYSVGAEGWKIPSGSYYEDWLADKTFVPGDVLVFKYAAGSHSVLQVSKDDYASCNVATPIKSYLKGGDKVPLPTAGDYYFICGFPGHCDGNQKIQITVTEGTPVAAPSTNATAPASSTPPKAPSSASGLRAAGALVCSALMVFVSSLVL